VDTSETNFVLRNARYHGRAWSPKPGLSQIFAVCDRGIGAGTADVRALDLKGAN
jgi:hypothetical protein